MPVYAVFFDHEWQGKSRSRGDAVEWARDVAETGRLVCVVKRRLVRSPRLVAVFPEDRYQEIEEAYRKGEIHPLDLKKTVGTYLAGILSCVRDYIA